MWAYWVYLQGHKRSHPAKAILYDFWSLGWVGNVKAESVGLCDRAFLYQKFRPGCFRCHLDFNIQQMLKEKSKQGVT